jgi:hypothetical protein
MAVAVAVVDTVEIAVVVVAVVVAVVAVIVVVAEAAGKNIASNFFMRMDSNPSFFFLFFY